MLAIALAIAVVAFGLLALAVPNAVASPRSQPSSRPAALPQASPTAHASGDLCDYACLTGFLDKYLAALAAHDPSQLPVAAHVKFTENTIPLKLGDALWGTFSGMGPTKFILPIRKPARPVAKSPFAKTARPPSSSCA